MISAKIFYTIHYRSLAEMVESKLICTKEHILITHFLWKISVW